MTTICLNKLRNDIILKIKSEKCFAKYAELNSRHETECDKRSRLFFECLFQNCSSLLAAQQQTKTSYSLFNELA